MLCRLFNCEDEVLFDFTSCGKAEHVPFFQPYCCDTPNAIYISGIRYKIMVEWPCSRFQSGVDQFDTVKLAEKHWIATVAIGRAEL